MAVKVSDHVGEKTQVEADVTSLDDPLAPPEGSAPSEYVASIFPGREIPLEASVTETLAKLEVALGMPIWLILQGQPDHPFGEIDGDLAHAFRHEKDRLTPGEPVALVINSPGGNARSAYEIARLICRRCGGFTAIVPDRAMSAATLLVVGAQEIVMGTDAALGPLDAQLWDPETETYDSVLNEVQALERLRAYALESIDETMFLLVRRTGKKVDSVLPHVIRFVTESTRPLFEKIDVVHYNERARMLRVAEEYAVRLLRGRLAPDLPKHHHGTDRARDIASHLVEKYPEHGFTIEPEEAKAIGLPVKQLTDETSSLMEDLWVAVQGVTAIGQFEEREALHGVKENPA